MRRLALMLAATLSVGGVAPASAQTERLPLTSRAERQIIDTNRALDLQQRELRRDQQTQFEINQLRNQLQQQQIQPIRPPCAIGTVC